MKGTVGRAKGSRRVAHPGQYGRGGLINPVGGAPPAAQFL